MSDTPAPHPMGAPYEAMRQRVHGLADDVHRHGTELKLHDLRLTNVASDVTQLAERAATREQLTASLEIIQSKLDGIAEKVGALMQAARWAVITVLSAIIIAFMGFALNGGLKP